MNSALPEQSLPARRVVSIRRGNTVQIAGVVFGAAMLWISGQPIGAGIRISAMIAGYLLIYFNTHAVMHFLIGNLVGIRFQHYSIGGSSHTSMYPLLMRSVFERLPFFAARTAPPSMKEAHAYAKALMFAAGIGGTVFFPTVAALYSFYSNTPGGFALLVFNIVWLASSLLVEMRSSGDLGKAFRALRGR